VTIIVIVAENNSVWRNWTNFRQISRDLTTRNIEAYDGTEVVQDIAPTYLKLLSDLPDVIR